MSHLLDLWDATATTECMSVLYIVVRLHAIADTIFVFNGFYVICLHFLVEIFVNKIMTLVKSCNFRELIVLIGMYLG